MPDLRASGIAKAYGGAQVLRGVSLHLAPGELVVVVGPSGCGKSTLLRCLSGLELPDAGAVTLGGEAPPPDVLRRRVGLVFQSFHLFPHLTLLENVTLAPLLLGLRRPDEARERATGLLARLGLGPELADRRPHELSGGQQQRAAIARALALEPDAVLYDEPTSALDPERTADVLALLHARRDEGIAQVVVTHDLPLARALGGRVIHLDAGEVVGDAVGLLDRPADERTRRFLRACLA